MAARGEVAALHVSDEAFLVASTIERCPSTMMLRELMMNALEAASLAPEGRRIVEIRALDFSGVAKLAIWNTGPGMDDQELHVMCDLAASIGKEKGLDANFGMGAKVASLPSNRDGIRYRSCKNGVVSEVILCQRDGVYGRLRRYSEDGEYWGEVIDATELAREEGRDLSEDWTEVVLLGNRLAQDTVRDPYDGDPECDRQWLATYLYHRFHRLPEGVEIRLLEGTHKLDGTRTFEPILRRLHLFERHETVDVGGGIRIHYLYDAPYGRSTGHNRSISGAIASAVSTCAVVYKDEMYDVCKGRHWTLDAPIFGIPFGARHISIHIELSADFPVRPEGYRQFLRYRAGEQGQVSVSDFAERVRENRPQWLIEVIRSYAPSSPSSTDDVREELQKLLNSLRIRTSSPKLAADGTINVECANGKAVEPFSRGSGGDSGVKPGLRHIDLSVVRSGARRANISRNMERAPEPIPLDDDEEIEQKEIKGRAGRYYIETGQLFLNMRYPAVAEMKELLEREYAGAADVEVMRGIALDLARKTMILRVGRAVVYALAKQLNKEWDHEGMMRALAPESLSLVADDYLDALQSARRRIGKTLRIARQEIQESSAEEVAMGAT